MVAFKEVQGFTDALAREFKARRVVLFGSLADGRAGAASDVDLLVTMDYKGSRLKTAANIIRKLKPRFAVDLVIRTEEEVAERLRQSDEFLGDILKNGKVLYEAVD